MFGTGFGKQHWSSPRPGYYSEFGYRVQALAGHVLLGLGHSIVEINQKGLPDLIGDKDGQEFRFEVEAEVLARRPRMLTPSDFDGLTGSRVEGYFAVAVSFPQPCWVLLPVLRLASRESPSGMALLRALSDKTFSSDEQWTGEVCRVAHGFSGHRCAVPCVSGSG